jgi:photosystem II stability/assembly factor-like uncharacterized protein
MALHNSLKSMHTEYLICKQPKSNRIGYFYPISNEPQSDVFFTVCSYIMKQITFFHYTFRRIHLLFFILPASFLNSAVGCAQDWDWQNPLPQGVNLFGVHFPDDTTGYSVGMDGTILKTVNGGQDWFAQESGVGTTFESVFFPQVDTGYVVGYGNNTIHKTTNGGLDWVEIPEAAQALTEVFFLNTNLGYAVGSNGVAATVIKTTNGGADWEVQHTGTVTFYNAVYFVNDSVGYIAGGGGRLLKTTNGGQTWVTQTSGTTQTIQSLYFHDEQNGYGVSYGRIIKTINGGATWTSTNIFQAFELYDVKFTDWNTGYAVGRSGIILRTTNAGASWSIVTTGTNITLRAVSFADALHGVAVGESGITLTTADAGLTWVPFSTSGYYEDLKDAHFPSDCNGFSVGDNGTVLKTIDGGANWIAQNSGVTNRLSGVHFTSDEVGYVVGTAGLIAKTIDGGATWSTQTSGLTVELNDVYFTSVDTGFVAGSAGNILKTTDGGATWFLLSSNVSNILTAIHFVDANLGFVVGSSGRVLKTINGGTTWNILFSGTTLDLHSVFFPTAQIGYIAGVSGHIRKTINGGTNWTQLTNNINIALTSLAFIDANNGYAVGYDYNRYGKIYHTTNGGTNWTVETISWDHDLNAVQFVDANTVYMVGNNGAILKTKMEATTATNTGPVCEGETIALSVPTIPGASYFWSGPNDFSSTLQNPSIVGASIAMSGVYTVWISVNDCTNAMETTNITIHETPATPLIVQDGPFCVGEPLALSTQEVANASYAWIGPNGFSSTVQNPLVGSSSALTMAGTYALTTTVNNCTSEAAEAVVEIIAIPATPLIAHVGPFCVGSSTSLATPSVANANYLWTGPNGFTSTDQNPILSPSATIDLNGLYALAISVSGCTSFAAETTVLVYENPSTPMIIQDGPVCAGSPLSLSTPDVSDALYVWTGPNGFSSTVQNPLVGSASDLNMAGTYALTTTVNNCTSEAAEAVVEINAIPATPVISNNGPLCEGSLSALSAPLMTDASYVWTGPNGFVSTDQNPILSPSATIDLNGLYALTISVAGCTSFAAETTVLVYEIPSTPMIIQDGPVCEGSPLSLSTQDVANASYTWTGPNGFSSTDQSPLVGSTSDLNMAGTYALTTTVNNCTSEVAEAVVEINAIPATPVISNNGPVCEGGELGLSAEKIPGASYSWTGPDGFTSSDQNPIVGSNAIIEWSGMYAVTATIGNCSSASAQTTVIVQPTPDAPVASSNGPVDEGTLLTLSATTISGASYWWTGPNGFTSAEQNPIVSEEASMAMAGNYNVSVTVNDCESAVAGVNVAVNEPNDIDYKATDFGVSIYPNPASESMWIHLSGVDFRYVEIMNALGEVIVHDNLNQPTTEIEISSLASGMYVVVLWGEGRRVEEKLIKY